LWDLPRQTSFSEGLVLRVQQESLILKTQAKKSPDLSGLFHVEKFAAGVTYSMKRRG